MSAFRKAMHIDNVRWCPSYMLSGFTVLWGISGAPRCPMAASAAVLASAWRNGQAWGPPYLRENAHRTWDQLLLWVDRGSPGADNHKVARARRTIAQYADYAPQDSRSRAALGRSLYVAAWITRHPHRAQQWLMDKSAARRWSPTQGQKWAMMSHIHSYTAGFHVLRLLANALPRGARWRTQRARDLLRTCCNCP